MPPDRVIECDDSQIRDAGGRAEQPIHTGQRDVVAADDQDVVGAADNAELAGRVDAAQVRGLEPTRLEPLTGKACGVGVAGHHHGSADPQSVRAFESVAPIDLHTRKQGTHAAVGGDALQRMRRGRDLRRGLGHAVGEEERPSGIKCALGQHRTQGLPTHQNDTQRRRRRDARLEQATQHRRHQRNMRHWTTLQILGNGLRIESLMQDQPPAGERPAMNDRQTADMAQTQTTEPDIIGPETEAPIHSRSRDEEILAGQHHDLGSAAAAAGLHEQGELRIRGPGARRYGPDRMLDRDQGPGLGTPTPLRPGRRRQLQELVRG